MGLKPLIAGMSQGGGSVATATLDGVLVTNAQTLSAAQIAQVRGNLGEITTALPSNVVKTDGTGLYAVFSVSLPAGTYRFNGLYSITISANTPGAKFTFGFTGTTSQAFVSTKLYTTNDLVGGGLTAIFASWAGANQTKTSGSDIGVPTGGYIHQVVIEGTLVVTAAGTFTISVSQNNAHAATPSDATTFYAGSYTTLMSTLTV